MGDRDLSYIGVRDVWGGEGPFGVSQWDRRQHLYIIGRTGVGKTTLLRNLVIQDIHAGRGVALIDPHGDLAYDLLDHIPRSRTDDVIFFDPSDLEYPIGLNILENVPEDTRPLVAENVVSIFRHIWGLTEASTPRLLRLLYACVAALLDFPKDPGATLLGINRMVLNDAYRDRVVRHVKNPKIRSFWVDEFPQWNERYRADAIGALGNVTETFLVSPVLRNIFGQPRSSFRFRDVMDKRRILIASLSKGVLGEQSANLIGSLIVSTFQTAALGRADLGEEERVDFHLTIDEFHNFATTSFASLLSEARKYRLCLTLAHQYTAQLSPEILAAVLGNCGSLASFRIGADDAERLAGEFAPYPPETLRELSRGEILAQLLNNGNITDPFVAKTLPPLDTNDGKRDNIIQQSRMRHGRPRKTVEGKITRWLS